MEQAVGEEDESAEVIEELSPFREVIQRWHAATVLPIDQLMLDAVAGDLHSTCRPGAGAQACPGHAPGGRRESGLASAGTDAQSAMRSLSTSGASSASPPTTQASIPTITAAS